MSRLVVFGCSITHGQGLIDPQKEVWGAVLAQLLDKEFVNNGKPGASNKFISHAVSKFNFEPDDFVIIAWTFLSRYSLLLDNETSHLSQTGKELPCINLRAERQTKESITYFKYFYNEYDSNFNNSVFVDFTVDLLLHKQINFKQIFYRAEQTPDCRHKNTNTFPFTIFPLYLRYPKASDNLHMGPLGNSHLADLMYEDTVGILR